MDDHASHSGGQVKRGEELLRAMIESAPTAMVMVDAGGHIVLVNAETEKLFGYARAELMGNAIEMLVPARFRAGHPGMRSAYSSHREARRMGAGRDLYGVRRDGSEFPVEIGLNPIDTEQGSFVLGAIADITLRKNAEAALRGANEVLERRVLDRTAEIERHARDLARAKDVLEKSNLELQQFAYIASHDLQTPLRAISGFAQLLDMHYKDKLDERAAAWIGRIVNGAQNMHELIRALLGYARVDSHAKAHEEVHIGELIDDVLSWLDLPTLDKDARVTRDEMPVVRGDRVQLAQLFQNLIGNGIKYRSELPPAIHIAATVDYGWHVITVSDNGIGIPPQHHPHIFEIFYRAHANPNSPGTGIGLAICRRVVHRHGGEIQVLSEPGAGSTFVVKLPVESAA